MKTVGYSNVVKAIPNTELGEWQRWQNDFQSRMVVNFGKKIQVVQIDNEQDWEFVVVDRGNKILGLAVF